MSPRCATALSRCTRRRTISRQSARHARSPPTAARHSASPRGRPTRACWPLPCRTGASLFSRRTVWRCACGCHRAATGHCAGAWPRSPRGRLVVACMCCTCCTTTDACCCCSARSAAARPSAHPVATRRAVEGAMRGPRPARAQRPRLSQRPRPMQTRMRRAARLWPRRTRACSVASGWWRLAAWRAHSSCSPRAWPARARLPTTATVRLSSAGARPTAHRTWPCGACGDLAGRRACASWRAPRSQRTARRRAQRWRGSWRAGQAAW
ncbi:hypothetical protein T492DRAFT_993095 [Pavlovales sp. CCMP2436]|nr:hypothetical protein T492DRAFT_993095 [Pavlovales sp. CCMP2436]